VLISALRVPALMEEVLPFLVLLGSIAAFMELSRRMELVVTRAAGHYRLGFRSAVRNLGAGPLVITGHRPDRSLDAMVADQVLEQDGGPSRVVGDVGRLRYVVSPDHRHWHLLGFERYTLERPGGRVVVRDRKTGFCLGDRYQAAASAAPKRYTSRCGLGQPARLGIEEGISVGRGDAYAANLEGQYLPLDGLPAGSYRLVHRVNADGRLREQRADNNASSLRLSLRWRRGVPRIRVLASCPDRADC
jgi:hypothetical protein